MIKNFKKNNPQNNIIKLQKRLFLIQKEAEALRITKRGVTVQKQAGIETKIKDLEAERLNIESKIRTEIEEKKKKIQELERGLKEGKKERGEIIKALTKKVDQLRGYLTDVLTLGADKMIEKLEERVKELEEELKNKSSRC